MEDGSAIPLRSVHESKRQKEKSMHKPATALPPVLEKGAECEEERQAEKSVGNFREVVGRITSAAARGR